MVERVCGAACWVQPALHSEWPRAVDRRSGAVGRAFLTADRKTRASGGRRPIFRREEFLLPRPKVGERAPDFTLPNADGEAVRLGELLARKVVVLYFYPKDETAGCTVEACAFRDAYEDFTAAGAEVVGVSRDDFASHTRFAAHHKLPFTLLSDAGGTLPALYGRQSHPWGP